MCCCSPTTGTSAGVLACCEGERDAVARPLECQFAQQVGGHTPDGEAAHFTFVEPRCRPFSFPGAACCRDGAPGNRYGAECVQSAGSFERDSGEISGGREELETMPSCDSTFF